LSAASVGGVDYNKELVILETSPDGDWQRVWSNGVEGWIKAGNVSPTGASTTETGTNGTAENN